MSPRGQVCARSRPARRNARSAGDTLPAVAITRRQLTGGVLGMGFMIGFGLFSGGRPQAGGAPAAAGRPPMSRP